MQGSRGKVHNLKQELRNTGAIMKNLIIFDMDGVIIDSEPEYQKRTKKFMARNGLLISDELCIKTCGSNRKDTYELFRKYVPGFNMSCEEYYELFLSSLACPTLIHYNSK